MLIVSKVRYVVELRIYNHTTETYAWFIQEDVFNSEDKNGSVKIVFHIIQYVRYALQ